MSSTLSATIRLAITASQADSIDLETVTSALSYSKAKALTNGTGNNQANVMFSDTRTLTASSEEDLDLVGVLADAFGKILTFTKLKAIIVKALDANTNNVLLSRPANGVPFMTASGDEIIVPPDGIVVATFPKAGITVTPSTGNLIHLKNSGGTTGVTFDIVIIGVGTKA